MCSIGISIVLLLYCRTFNWTQTQVTEGLVNAWFLLTDLPVVCFSCCGKQDTGERGTLKVSTRFAATFMFLSGGASRKEDNDFYCVSFYFFANGKQFCCSVCG